ncbi:hypothetical protein [Salegentibacter sp. Hel_I_6]|uniref:hypothetical protein n=1 Tax=Salegentibacter sp. Hel_I_6 TaxID=1250278 RepID=UPI000561EEEE|nr:hypothetical protein [Salegentibacter sp. Hel_I_6]
MGTTLNKEEKQQIISTLNYAAHKMIKELEQNKMVGNLDFYNLCVDHFKGGVWLGLISKLNYYHYDYEALYVKIKCKYLGSKFKVTFLMKEPEQKDDSKQWEAYNLEVEEKLNL